MYFDSAATTLQKPPQVGQAMLRALRRCASVGRSGHRAAMEAAETVFACRETAGRLFGAEAEQVVFTMNATHGLNLALHSLCRPGMRVVCSGFEHNAVLRTLRALRVDLRIAGRSLFDAEGCLRDFAEALSEGVELVVCNCCSNVFGYVLPTKELAKLCRSYGVPLILDASQAAGTLPVSLRDSGAAFIAMPGHKGLYGPQGTGILLCAAGGEPLLYGGTGGDSLLPTMPDFLPDRLEAGTHNVCGIAGLLEGLRFVERRTPQRILRHERQLLSDVVQGLSAVEGLHLFAGDGQSGVLSLTVQGRDCEELAHKLAQRDVAVRAGLHCAPLAHESGGTLREGTLRLSFSAFNTRQEVKRLVEICKKVFAKV